MIIMINFATSCHMLTISTVMQIQQLIYLPVPTLPTDASDSDTNMVAEAETCLKRLVLLPEGTSCVKHRGNGVLFWLGGLLIAFLIPKVFI